MNHCENVFIGFFDKMEEVTWAKAALCENGEPVAPTWKL